jgi:hypothetical protein
LRYEVKSPVGKVNVKGKSLNNESNSCCSPKSELSKNQRYRRIKKLKKMLLKEEKIEVTTESKISVSEAGKVDNTESSPSTVVEPLVVPTIGGSNNALCEVVYLDLTGRPKTTLAWVPQSF